MWSGMHESYRIYHASSRLQVAFKPGDFELLVGYTLEPFQLGCDVTKRDYCFDPFYHITR